MLDRPVGELAGKRSFHLLPAGGFGMFEVSLWGLTAAPLRRPAGFAVVETNDTTMFRIAGPLLGLAIALANSPANAQAGATPATCDDHSSTAIEHREASAQPATADDVCRGASVRA